MNKVEKPDSSTMGKKGEKTNRAAEVKKETVTKEKEKKANQLENTIE